MRSYNIFHPSPSKLQPLKGLDHDISMAIGTLNARVVLDEPSTIHYGSADPVKGKVILTYMPSAKTREESSLELFAPLQLALIFHGRSKTKIWKSSGQNQHIYRARVPLFSARKKIYDDSVRIRQSRPQEIPFTLYFPESYAGSQGLFEENSRFQVQPAEPLPPSFNNSYHGFANRYECFVEYRIGVVATVPRLQVEIVTPEKDYEPQVYYDYARLPAAMNARPSPRKGWVSVQNELLLPEADRPVGFRAKAKAALSSNYYPTYGFDWTILAPQHLYVGQPLALEVAIRPREKLCTAPLVPDVHLAYIDITIRAVIDVRAEKQLFSCPSAHSDEEKLSLKGGMLDKGPFSKANDWSKTINTRELRGVCSTYQTANISLTYRMNIRGSFTVAGKSKDFESDFTVVIHPPIERADAEAGSSAQPLGMASLEAALPQYDRPPEYDEAVSELPEAEAVSKDKEKPIAELPAMSG